MKAFVSEVRVSVRGSRARRGFTLVELLNALALIVFIMSLLSQAFVQGLQRFSQLKGVGDLAEPLLTAGQALNAEIGATGVQAWAFVEEGLRTGQADPDEAAELRARYEAIGADAVALEAQMRDALGRIDSPAARQLLERSLREVDELKLSATLLVDLLRLLE
jgi:prepilin-type N-terminal cleavage/methylation domain-containing protein